MSRISALDHTYLQQNRLISRNHMHYLVFSISLKKTLRFSSPTLRFSSTRLSNSYRIFTSIILLKSFRNKGQPLIMTDYLSIHKYENSLNSSTQFQQKVWTASFIKTTLYATNSQVFWSKLLNLSFEPSTLVSVLWIHSRPSVLLCIRPSVTKFSQDWIISFFWYCTRW